LLPVDLHAHHRVGVLELAVGDEQRETAEVMCAAVVVPTQTAPATMNADVPGDTGEDGQRGAASTQDRAAQR
jgi:hypothetical protein